MSLMRAFLKKELLQTLRDPRMRRVLFIAPLFQLTLFGVALSHEVRNVRLAAVLAPADQGLRDIYQRAIASRWFVAAEVQGEDPFEWIRSGQADAVLVSPPGGLTRAVGRGQADLQLLINAQNVLRAQAVEGYIRSIVPRVFHPEGGGAMGGVRFDVRALYNPTFETSVYMVPGVMCILVCIVTILLTAMSVAREREIGTLEMLISAPVRPWEIVLGKTVPFVSLGMLQVPLILGAAMILFGIPMRGPLWMLLLAAFFFVSTTVALGLLISTLAQNQQQAMLGSFLFLFPAVLLSGLMFPIENMPWAMRMLTELNPLSHFVALLRNILLKGGDLGFFLKHVAALAALAGLSSALALKRFRTTLG